MTKTFIEELKCFALNAYNFRFKSLLSIIIILILIPGFLYYKLENNLCNNFNDTMRFIIVYLINIYHLILIYNNKIEEVIVIQNGGDIINNEVINDVRPIDVLRRFIEQAGINLDGLIDIDIIQIEMPMPQDNDVVINNNDTQNVHDTSVQSHITTAINNLKKDTFTLNLSIEAILIDIRHFILNISKSSDTIKDRALSTLKRINKQNGILTRSETTELEILKLVWDRIHNPVNSTIINTLKENLIIELADAMIDDDSVHCLQGRISRIIQTLECADMEGIVNLKPLWVIKEEMGTVFGKCRNKLYKKLSDQYKEIYDKVNPTPQETIIINKINIKLKNMIDIYLRKRYVQSEIINENQYFVLTKDYYEAI